MTDAPSPAASVRQRAASISALRLGVEGGGLGSLGLLGNPAFGGYVGALATAWGGPSVRVRGARLVATSADLADGQVLVDLWAAFIAACWRLPVGALAIHPCLDFGAGSQRGEGRDFTLENHTVHRPFLSLGPSLTATLSLVAGIEAALTAGIAANLWRQEYVVPPAPPADPLAGGDVQRQERVGAFLGIGLATAWTFGG